MEGWKVLLVVAIVLIIGILFSLQYFDLLNISGLNIFNSPSVSGTSGGGLG